MYRHLLEVARSMLFLMNVPQTYWGYVLTASYLINRLLTCVLGKKSPLEVFFKSFSLFLFLLESLDVTILFETIIHPLES